MTKLVLRELLLYTEYTLVKGDMETEISGLSFDSRQTKSGQVFVCIRGMNTDGHQYVNEAIQKGAVAIVAEEAAEVPEDVTLVLTPSGQKALAIMACNWFGHPAEKMVTIGITGTKGKTTVACMIKAILEAAGEKTGYIGTLGADMGNTHEELKNTTPDAVTVQKLFRQMADAGCRYLVMEVSSQGLKLDRVSGFIFDYGIFTNLSPDHIGAGEHKDFEEYLSCKAKLFSRCRTGIVNADDSHVLRILAGRSCSRVVTYGYQKGADYCCNSSRLTLREGHPGIEFCLSGRTEETYYLKMPGRFNVYNAMAAVSACHEIGIPSSSYSCLENVTVPGRTQSIVSEDGYLVVIDYAHNEVSMEKLLLTLKEYRPGRLICVFGCGGNRSKLRRFGMGEISGRLADFTIVTADNSRYEAVEKIIADIKTGLARTDGNYVVIPDRREAIFYSIKQAKKGDMIAIIGKGHENYQEIEGVRYPFDDGEVAQEAIADKK